MIHSKCKKCGNWLREITIKKLNHHSMYVYVCIQCERGYEIYTC